MARLSSENCLGCGHHDQVLKVSGREPVYDNFCRHPAAPHGVFAHGEAWIGYSNSTPRWCPLLPIPGPPKPQAFSNTMADIACPSCTKPFRLELDEIGGPNNVTITPVHSRTGYDVKITCPHCGYSETI